MSKSEQILFILSSAEKIKKQLSNVPLSNLEERHRLTSELFSLDFAIKKFSKKEVNEALEIEEYKKLNINKKVIEEIEVIEHEEDFYYLFAVMLIMTSKSKNKAFLLLGAEIFLKGKRYEYRTKRIY
jgi:hypothetical protein